MNLKLIIFMAFGMTSLAGCGASSGTSIFGNDFSKNISCSSVVLNSASDPQVIGGTCSDPTLILQKN